LNQFLALHLRGQYGIAYWLKDMQYRCRARLDTSTTAISLRRASVRKPIKPEVKKYAALASA